MFWDWIKYIFRPTSAGAFALVCRLGYRLNSHDLKEAEDCFRDWRETIESGWSDDREDV